MSNVELRFLTEICGAEGPGGDMAAGELGLGGEAMMEGLFGSRLPLDMSGCKMGEQRYSICQRRGGGRMHSVSALGEKRGGQ